MRNLRANRILFFGISMFLCLGLIGLSSSGTLGPVEGILSVPINFISGTFTDTTRRADELTEYLEDLQDLQERNAELEEIIAQFQSELVQLREIESDYNRLASLVDYTLSTEDMEFVTADVISYDQSGRLRTIVINRGTRDGITIDMPVVTDQGLVGRIIQVSATASRILLITDESSFVTGRLQTTRALGSVQGSLTGNLVMIDILLDATVIEGDIVMTSGIGGNFPPDLVIGQVESNRRFEFELGQEAQIRSLIDFDTLEIVLVVTSFRPIDISVFEDEEAQ